MPKSNGMKTVENAYIRFWIEDGIMHSVFLQPTVVDLNVAKEIIRLRHEISAGEKQYWCFDFTNLKEYRKEARDYAEIHGQEYLHATAVLVNSHVTRFILNTFMRLKHSVIPLQAFKTKADATQWFKKLQAEAAKKKD
jgi:hypothetical protein